ncbi:MAG: hypothetical protein ACRDM0_01640 [Thermoleophilaceae bacterium]
MGKCDPRLSIRWAAGSMAIAAGAVHVAQVQVHTYEDPSFGAFFGIVGVLQVLGGVYLVRPLGPDRIRRGVAAFGIAGSLAVIGIWAISRTFGLPFGAEPGETESVGLADAAAGLFEIFTALLLLLWLRQTEREALPVRWALTGCTLAISLAGGWIALRALEVFDPDPRLVLRPELTDAAAMAFLLLVSALFAGLAARSRGAIGRTAVTGFLAVLVVSEVPLVALTIPPRGGQNLECRYAPLAEDSGLSHSEPSDPIDMHVGERRSVVVLQLAACADAPVELGAVRPLQPIGEAIVIESVSVDPTRIYRTQRVREAPGPDSMPLAGFDLLPAAGRQPVTIQVRAVAAGEIAISAFRVEYVYRGEPGSFAFASVTSFCVGDACEGH